MNATNDLTLAVTEIEAMLDGASIADPAVSTRCDATADDTTGFVGSIYC